MAFSGPIATSIIRNQADWKPIFRTDICTKMKTLVSEVLFLSTILSYFTDFPFMQRHTTSPLDFIVNVGTTDFAHSYYSVFIGY